MILLGRFRAESTGVTTATRLPSGARSHVALPAAFHLALKSAVENADVLPMVLR
jgi:hypothetical protein